MTAGTTADALTVVPATSRLRRVALRVGVLVLPALGVPARRYAALGRELAGRGVPTGLYEIRGQGQRRRPTRADDYGYTELADEVGPAIAGFRDRTGVQRVVLMGHSLGGQLSLIHAALFEPHDVVFVASGLPYWRDYPLPFSLAMLPAGQLIGLIPQLLRVSPAWNFGGAQSRGVMWDWGHTARTGRWPSIHGVDPLEALAEARIRILAVHIENDPYTPPAVMRRVLRAAASAEITEYEYTEVDARAPLDHINWTRAPGSLAEVVAAFCRGDRLRPASATVVP